MTSLSLTELLDSECTVDLEHLTNLVQRGDLTHAPQHARPDAWKYLLGVSSKHKSRELSRNRHIHKYYAELSSRAATDAAQPHARPSYATHLKRAVRDYGAAHAPYHQPHAQQMLERLLRAYLHESGAPFQPGLVELAAPFCSVYAASEADAYHALAELMRHVEWGHSFAGRKAMSVMFMTLLRHVLPEVYVYFEHNGFACDGSPPWLNSWLQFLLARELPIESLLALWDCYFASLPFSESALATATAKATATLTTVPPGSLLELHVFVCLAVLESCQEELLELDGEEALRFLQRMPRLDGRQLVAAARDIRVACAVGKGVW